MNLDAVAILIGDDDPATACVLARVFERIWSVNSLLDPRIRARLDPRAAEAANRQADSLTIADAGPFALACLDEHYPPT